MDVLHADSYRGHEIKVIASERRLDLEIDGRRVLFNSLLDGERYATPYCPYRTYPDLISLGRAVVRSGNWIGKSSEVPS